MKNSDLKQFWLVLLPSWLSGLAALLISLFAVIGTVVISQFQSSSLRQELFDARHSGVAVSSFDFKNITNNLAQNHIVSNMPLFLFWAGIGVIVYFFAVSIAGAFGGAVEMERELSYVNAPRQRLIRSVAVSTVGRLAVLAAWIAYLQLFMRVLLPYALGAAHVAASSNILGEIGYAALAVAVLATALQVHVVLLRLIFLRVRLFGEKTEMQ